MMLANYQLVGQAILPAAAFQAALWGRMASCAPVANRRFASLIVSLSTQAVHN
jgi:hypothetical protein